MDTSQHYNAQPPPSYLSYPSAVDNQAHHNDIHADDAPLSPAANNPYDSQYAQEPSPSSFHPRDDQATKRRLNISEKNQKRLYWY